MCGQLVELEGGEVVQVRAAYDSSALRVLALLATQGPSPRVEVGLSRPEGMRAHRDCEKMTSRWGVELPSACFAAPVHADRADPDVAGAALVLSDCGVALPMGVGTGWGEAWDGVRNGHPVLPSSLQPPARMRQQRQIWGML